MKKGASILFLILILSSVTFAQKQNTNAKIWIETISNNSIEKGNKGANFKSAANGYALYFSQVDTLRIPYLVYVPKAYDPSKQYPLVVYLHGGVASIDSFQYKNPASAQEPIFSIADKYNAIILFPFGKKDFGWVKQQKAFINILNTIELVSQTYNIDKQKIYLGGMSNGASAAFWFITNKPEVFAGFYAFSPMPKMVTGEINYKNITANKPLYSINAKDDEGFPYAKVKNIYEEHKKEALGWHFDSVNTGGHGFIYGDSGTIFIDNVFEKLFKEQTNCFLENSVRDSLIKELFVVDEDDQKYRNQMDDVQAKYGGDSKEMKNLLKSMKQTDSIDLVKVSFILDNYGWLGFDIIGDQGNTTLFMVIQHSNLKTQEKYLPMLRQAVKNGKAKARHLALLEDRVAILQGRKQIYGSQVSWNVKTNIYYVLPLEDPDNVDKRRAEVGLSPLAEYLENMGIKWDVEQYKKDLPTIEANFFKK
jgi:predicted esterase